VAGKVTVDLASHWTRVTDISGSPPKPWRGRWAPAYALLVEYDKLNLYLYSRIAQVPGWSPGEDPLGIAGVSFLQAKYGMSFLSPNQQCQSIEVLSYLSISHSTYIVYLHNELPVHFPVFTGHVLLLYSIPYTLHLTP